MTTYRVIFLPEPTIMLRLSKRNPSVHAMLSMPLATIDRVEVCGF
jgi:hypothetical protein